MKSILILAVVVLFSTTISHAQIKNAKTETVKVYGDCGMCKTTIEKAASEKKISKAEWNEDTKMATIVYDSKKTSLDAVLKNIALAGYDNVKFLAPDETYNKLPGCCKYEREKKVTAKTDNSKMATNPDIHAGHDHNAMNKKADTAISPSGTQLQSVLENYFLVKDALVRSDGTTTSAKAITLLAALNAVKMESLKGDEHSVWMEMEKNLKFHAQHISENKDATHQREHFAHLSKGMYAMTKVAKSNETIYWQNCPMYNDGKGANWLSKESAIKNPYYGSMMLTCGKNVQTIK